ncbi:MAG: 2OG-Fe(II) oxygenase [Verrucomicrobiaceae bacterium]|nr:2OG-Fe(II) oxygenase [Verrucomicrobiaceae bacterium]
MNATTRFQKNVTHDTDETEFPDDTLGRRVEDANAVTRDASLRARFAALHADARTVRTPLISVDQLDEKSLLDLVLGNTLAVEWNSFIFPSNALQIADKLLAASTWGRYETAGADGIEINGRALFECGGNRKCPDYFEKALPSRRAVRRLLSPLTCPIDAMQAALDECWRPGARVLTLNGQKCHVGLQRCFREGGEALHHNDRARIDFAHAKTACMQFQIALNTYLSVAAGGELELWNLAPPDDLYDAARYPTGTTYAVRGELLPPPDLTIRPTAGSFILFNAGKLHRVRPVLGDGARVTVSAFAGFSGLDQPLELFS